MARYRAPRYYPRSYRRSTMPAPAKAALAFGAAVVLAGAGHTAVAAHAGTHHVVAAPAQPAAVATAIAYARAQLGKPYLWGGTGPGAFDCSGLMMMAYAAAGVSILRTSQEQWASLPHVPAGQARPGDLVFAPGSDGTWAAPGHVGMLLSGGRVLQAYATGYLIAVTSLSNFAAGAGGIVGFARPAGVR